MKQFLLNIALALTMALTAMAGSKVDIYDLSLD